MNRKPYPEDFKTLFGVYVMHVGQIVGNALIGSFLMLYITDYAGIYTGIAGKAAAVATVMLLVGRIWDAVNDPILGFVMDRSPRTRWGKFKPFVFGGTLASTLLIIALFNIPSGLPDVMKVVWLYVFYIIFDSAFTLIPYMPLTRTLTNDVALRSKMVTGQRIVSLVVSMAISGFIAIAVALGPDGTTPNIGLAVIVFMIPATTLALLGTSLVKEGSSSADQEKVTLKDAIAMVKRNKPLLLFLTANFFGGFVFFLVNAAMFYYVKYALGAENLGTNSAILGGILLVGMIIGTFVSQQLQKRVTPGMGLIIAFSASIVPLIVMWVLNLAGPISNPALFYPLMALVFLGISLYYIPQRLVTMECMDYNQAYLDKSMEGLINSSFLFVEKLQAGVGAALVGLVLTAVGYDAELYQDATTIPPSLFRGLGLVIFALPALMALISIGVTAFYPLLRKSQRDAVYAEINGGEAANVT